MKLNAHAVSAAFASPGLDGEFDPDLNSYLNELGKSRPSIVLAFAPKAAGTFLRTACIAAINGQLVRTVHAQGGRDASFYLPTFLAYYAAGHPNRALVTHVHMQALPANRHFIEAFDLKPIIMVRSIPDMLTSYLDMLQTDPHLASNWLNICLPNDYAGLGHGRKADFIVDMMGPWYVSYFSSWLDYAAKAPGRVCILTYDSFIANPAETLERLLGHSRLPRPRQRCKAALDETWTDRTMFRFSKGVPGRGHERFTQMQIARLENQLNFYPNLNPLRDVLIPSGYRRE